MYFHLDLSKTRIEICVAFIDVWAQLDKKYFNLREIARITDLDYVSTLYREKDWLIKSKIFLINEDRNKYSVSFKNMAYVLFVESNLGNLYYLSHKFLDLPKNIEN